MVIGKLWKAIQTWEKLLQVLGREGLHTRLLVRFYLEVVQTMMIFDSDMWMVTPASVSPWGVSTTGSQGGSLRRNVGKKTMEAGSTHRWGETMREAGLEELET